ncbi:MAG: hypothetical protein KJ592_00385, partial [Nanoarchaeota archaeon]|nr:hypothetical protein [Nanoarchaeota archaeon]
MKESIKKNVLIKISNINIFKVGLLSLLMGERSKEIVLTNLGERIKESPRETIEILLTGASEGCQELSLMNE